MDRDTIHIRYINSLVVIHRGIYNIHPDPCGSAKEYIPSSFLFVPTILPLAHVNTPYISEVV